MRLKCPVLPTPALRFIVQIRALKPSARYPSGVRLRQLTDRPDILHGIISLLCSGGWEFSLSFCPTAKKQPLLGRFHFAVRTAVLTTSLRCNFCITQFQSCLKAGALGRGKEVVAGGLPRRETLQAGVAPTRRQEECKAVAKEAVVDGLVRQVIRQEEVDRTPRV